MAYFQEIDIHNIAQSIDHEWNQRYTGEQYREVEWEQIVK